MGGGAGEGYTTLLNNCGASQIENSKVAPEGIGILPCQHSQKEEDILPWQSLVDGYCQGAVVILIYNELVICYSPATELVLGPSCSTLPDIDGPWNTTNN